MAIFARDGLRLRQVGLGAVTLLSLAFLLAGCASRPEVGALLSNHVESAVGKDHTILVATTRERDSDQAPISAVNEHSPSAMQR